MPKDKSLKRKGNRGQNIIDFKEKTKQELKERKRSYRRTENNEKKLITGKVNRKVINKRENEINERNEKKR